MRYAAVPEWPEPRRPIPVLPPAVLALVVGAIQLVGSFGAAENQPDREPLNQIAVLLLLVGPAALVVRRRYPAPVLVVTAVATLTYLLLGFPYGPVFLSLIVALFTAVTSGHRLAAWVTGAALYLGHLGLAPLIGRRPGLGALEALGAGAWLFVVLLVAEAVRMGGARTAEVRRAKEEEARRRASEERLRIAQELHDVLAHNISLINVQAGVALHLMDEQPEQARTALTAIKQASKDALGELRSVLAVLRRLDEPQPRQPAPSLARLEDLIAPARLAGLRVRSVVEGDSRPLPAAVDLAAYRIVQEALTNVTRHAAAAHVTVRVAYGSADLSLQVDDDGGGGRSEGPPGSGTGILGMRERAAALGGELVFAGPRPGGGFRVLARLPLVEPDGAGDTTGGTAAGAETDDRA